LKVFGDKMPEILNLLKRNTQIFDVMPIGPIGQRITLQDAKWATAVEACIVSSLSSFIVNSHKDEHVFKELLKKAGISFTPPMIVQKFITNVYKIPQDRLPPREFPTILGNINADHPMVINVLIDQHRIEGKVLFKDRPSAEQVIFSSNKPRQILEGFLPNGGRLYKSAGTQVIQAHENSRRRFLGVNVEEAIREQEEKLVGVNKEVAELDGQASEIDKQARKLQEENTKLKRATQQLQHTVNRISGEIKDLTDGVKEAEAEPDIAELEENAKRIEDDIQQATESLSKSQEETKNYENEAQPVVTQLTDKKKKKAQS